MKKVEVVPHDPLWRGAFEAEAKRVAAALGGNVVAIHHIGSTAIPNIHAKPVIDLLVEVRDVTEVDGLSSAMESLGYEVLGEYGIPGRRYFRKDNREGVRTHNIHAFEAGSAQVERHLAFRDYMTAHPADAQRYGELKRMLAEEHPQSMDRYMDGKDGFIKEVDRRAALWRASQTGQPAGPSGAACALFVEEAYTGRAGLRVKEAVAILERTPDALGALLRGLPDVWARATEGDGTWSPYDVVGHLVHGERTDWLPRSRHILAGDPRPFESFDRTAQFAESEGKSLGDLLDEFTGLRAANLAELLSMNLSESDLTRVGRHPDFGEVTLGQLLATWVVHDLDHVAQVARTMAKVYADAVGSWRAYLSILQDRRENA